MIIDTEDLDPTSSYKLLIGSVLPRAIAWVSTSSTAGVGNIAPVSFFTVVGRFPPVLSITLQPRSDGVTLKDTFVNIRDTGEFVVNIATIGQADAVHRSAYEFDTDVDEFEALGLEKAAVRGDFGTAYRRRSDLLRVRRRPHHPDAAAARPRRVGTGQAHPRARRSVPVPRAHRRRRARMCSVGSPANTPWSTTSSPPRSPKSSWKRSAPSVPPGSTDAPPTTHPSTRANGHRRAPRRR